MRLTGLPKNGGYLLFQLVANWWVSTIGVGELNFSVRNGKRWDLTAITTAICYLREKTLSPPSGDPQPSIESFASFILGLSFFLRKSLGPLVQVS